MNTPSAPRYAPHLGVYGLILDAARTKVLLTKKALGCYTGLYDLPGGRMDAGETLEQTLRREISEETELTVTSCTQLVTHCAYYPFVKEGEAVVLQHVGVIYLADVAGTPRTASSRHAADDSDGCIWVDIQYISLANSAPLVVMALETWRQRGA